MLISVGTSYVVSDPLTASGPVEPFGVGPDEAARLLRCSRQTVYRLLGDGELQSFKIRGSRRVLTQSIADYVRRQTEADAR
jgi:excisionase family DNA binding protein